MKKTRKIYTAKPDTWFNEGEECELIVDLKNGSGLFSGFRTCENPESEGKWYSVGDLYLDQKRCEINEFIIDEYIMKEE